ncbi:MAG TPA: alpha/beta hydrolase, partial [Thermoanaerobaculia bacterium]|nr:alpha/beta hydrolase [Thermoanaerobaculia bacterium]
GLSVTEQIQKNPDMLDPEWLAASKEWRDPQKWLALADRFLFPDERPEDMEWAHSTLRPMRLDGLAKDPLPPDAQFPPSACIIATLDRTINPAWQERVWREKNYGRLIRMESGHCPQMSRPGETAKLILEAVATGERRGRVE